MTTELGRADGVTGPGKHHAAVGPTRGNVLLAETDEAPASRLMKAAAQIGIATTWCRDGAEALLAVGAQPPGVLVLAANIDTVDAPRIAAAVRSHHSDLPILIGAAPGQEELTRQAMAAGASAVIARPYDITAIAPFALNASNHPHQPSVFIAGPIYVDLRGYETKVRSREVQLTQRELELLVFLIQRRGRVASQEEISRAVWGRSPDTNTIAVHVKRLREKLGEDPEHGEYIRTIRGVGYRLAPSICA